MAHFYRDGLQIAIRGISELLTEPLTAVLTAETFMFCY